MVQHISHTSKDGSISIEVVDDERIIEEKSKDDNVNARTQCSSPRKKAAVKVKSKKKAQKALAVSQSDEEEEDDDEEEEDDDEEEEDDDEEEEDDDEEVVTPKVADKVIRPRAKRVLKTAKASGSNWRFRVHLRRR